MGNMLLCMWENSRVSALLGREGRVVLRPERDQCWQDTVRASQKDSNLGALSGYLSCPHC